VTRSRRTILILSILAWSAGALVALAWIAGRTCNDRFWWSQYLFWIPTLLALPGATLPALLGLWGWHWARREVQAPPVARPRRVVAGVTLAILSCSWLYATLGEWRLLSGSPTPHSDPFRVIHWNAAMVSGNSWTARVLEHSPDLVIINPETWQTFNALVQGMGPGMGEGTHSLFRHGFAILSKHRILRSAYTFLGVEPGVGIDPRQLGSTTTWNDPGRALFIELDTHRRLGRNLIVWAVDLPSDVSLHRRIVCEEAAGALARFKGDVIEIDALGRALLTKPLAPGFPPPDLLIGDLNTPRGSHSLRRLTGDLSSAFDQAGSGPCASWPSHRPLWHLDQAFLASWLRAGRYDVLGMGGGAHLGQVLELEIASARSPTIEGPSGSP
jgi:endonuclease/exonuclease/phosphatase family metal-dependent hydrolase